MLWLQFLGFFRLLCSCFFLFRENIQRIFWKKIGGLSAPMHAGRLMGRGSGRGRGLKRGGAT